MLFWGMGWDGGRIERCQRFSGDVSLTLGIECNDNVRDIGLHRSHLLHGNPKFGVSVVSCAQPLLRQVVPLDVWRSRSYHIDMSKQKVVGLVLRSVGGSKLSLPVAIGSPIH